jgi:hypothetical protein
MVAATVRQMHHTFKEWLLGVSGASSKWSRWEALPTLTEAISYAILRDRGVSGVFGVATPPGENWPYQPDANGDKVVEQISRSLDPGRMPPLTRESFSDLQRVALLGAEALAAVLDFDSEDRDEKTLRALITYCYNWYTALKKVQPVTMDTSVITPAVSPVLRNMPASMNHGTTPMLPA